MLHQLYTRGLAARPSILAEWRWVGLTTVWTMTIVVGFGLVVNFETKPAESAQSASAWPADSQLRLADEGATVIMFLHPGCPCSSASLDQLDRLLSETKAPVKTYLVIVGPTDTADVGPNETRAATISNALLWRDEAGEEAHLFGSQTSGDVFVFDRTGHLRFEGGITAARGHVGANAASAAALSAIEGVSTAECHMPVFGCPLF